MAYIRARCLAERGGVSVVTARRWLRQGIGGHRLKRSPLRATSRIDLAAWLHAIKVKRPELVERLRGLL